MFYSCPTCSELLCVVSRDLGTGCDWLAAREGGGEVTLTGGVEASQETANQSQRFLIILISNNSSHELHCFLAVYSGYKIFYGDFNIDINFFCKTACLVQWLTLQKCNVYNYGSSFLTMKS